MALRDRRHRRLRLWDQAVSRRKTILLHPDDNVVVACSDIARAEQLLIDGEAVEAGDAVTLGHKLARRDIGLGERVIKYGIPIGSATTTIARGKWVHMHNMKSDYIAAHDRNGSETPE